MAPKAEKKPSLPTKPAKSKSATSTSSKKKSTTSVPAKDEAPKATNKFWFIPTASVIASTIILCGLVVFVVPAFGLPELVSEGMFHGELPAETSRLGNEEAWIIIISIIMVLVCIGLIVHNYMVSRATWDVENIKPVGTVWNIVAVVLIVLVFLLVLLWLALLIYCVVLVTLASQIGGICRSEFATMKNNSALDSKCIEYIRYGLPTIKSECGSKNIAHICSAASLVEPSLTQSCIGALIVLLGTIFLLAIQAVNRRILLLCQKVREAVQRLKSIKPPSPVVQVKVVTLPGKTIHREDSESTEEEDPQDVLSLIRKKLSLTSADELEVVYL